MSQKEQPFYGSVTVGERGQVVVPVGARKRFNVNPGDKLLVFGIPGGVGFFRVSSAMGRLSSMQKALAEMTSDLAAAAEPVAGDTSGAPCGTASTAPGGASEKRAEEPSAKATGRGKKRS